MDVLISGASIAGPALAYWLRRHGHQVTIVEVAPALRTGGNAVDFRGELHLGILRQMGVLDTLRARQTGGTAMRFEDRDGRKLMEMPADFAGGDIEMQRGELAQVLVAAADCEMRYGDSIVTLAETATGVDVTFRSGHRQTYDPVIGADGVHSTVRRLTFGPEERFVKHLGYYVGGWATASTDRTWHAFNAPGRLMSVNADGAFVAFRSPALDYDRKDKAAQKRIITERFRDLDWRLTGELLGTLEAADDFYFDQICRVDVPHWSRGRIALVGDAASGATIGGQGCGTAVVQAYVLAGELATAPDHRTAFASYERLVRGFARRTQKGGDTAGRFLAPRRGYGIRLRNTLHNQPWFMRMMMAIADDRSTKLTLPDYSAARSSADSSASDGTTRAA